MACIIYSEVGEDDCQCVGPMWMPKMDVVDDISMVKNPEEFVRAKHVGNRGYPIRNVRVFVAAAASSVITEEVEKRIREYNDKNPAVEKAIGIVKSIYSNLHGTGWPVPHVTMLIDPGNVTVKWYASGDFPVDMVVTIPPADDVKYEARMANGKEEMELTGHGKAIDIGTVLAEFFKMSCGWFRP